MVVGLLCSVGLGADPPPPPGLTAAPAAAEGLVASQEGLPPALVISDQPPLDQQIQTLQQMTAWIERNRPKLGFWDKVKGFFGGGDRVPLVNLSQLETFADTLQGRLIAVEGLLAQEEPGDEATLRGETAGSVACRLSFAPGMIREGLPEELKGLPVRAEGVAEILASGIVSVRVQELQPGGALAYLRLGRIYEIQEDYLAAIKAYQQGSALAMSENYLLGAFGATRKAELTKEYLNDDKAAKKLYASTWNTYTRRGPGDLPLYYTWKQQADQTWERLPVSVAIAGELQALEEQGFWYKLVHAFVVAAAGNAALGLLLLALVTRMLVYPLTKKQLASARDMQRLQPQMKKLQEKHKGDKQKFQAEFWKLCQEHGVNPLGGCLPLLIQMPLLYFVYMGIRAYIVNLDGHSFLWVNSLAQPDLALLLLYTVSQIAFGKLTQQQNPAASMDPQQRQQQQMMTYMMPIMFFFLFQSFPAGFMLYWLGTNVVYIGQQLWYNRTAGSSEAAATPAKKGGWLAKLTAADTNPTSEKDKAAPRSYQQKKAATEGKMTSKEEASKRRKKRRWTRR